MRGEFEQWRGRGDSGGGDLCPQQGGAVVDGGAGGVRVAGEGRDAGGRGGGALVESGQELLAWVISRSAGGVGEGDGEGWVMACSPGLLCCSASVCGGVGGGAQEQAAYCNMALF
ncbi:hypothetical protein [Streptomyces sp. NPDC055094]